MYQKYPIAEVTVPKHKRKEINDKIIYILNNQVNSPIQPKDIFNAYTGDGGLHGLSRSEYESYYEYSEAKKEIEQGQFFTPHKLCKFIVGCLSPLDTDSAGDITFGMGNFFNYIKNESNVYGTELDIKAYKVAKHLYPKANLDNQDIRYWQPDVTLDVIFGNPPFNLHFKVGSDEYLSQLYYMIKASELLKPGGLMAVIVPSSFLADDFMDGGMIKEIDQRFSFVLQFDLPTDSFKSMGVDCFETKVLVLQKLSEHLDPVPYSIDKIEIGPLTGSESLRIYNTFIKPLQEQKEKLKSKLFLEMLRKGGSDEADFQYQVKKLLYDIKRHPKCKEHFGRAQEYVTKYYTQKKPNDMKWEDWDKRKITKPKVLAYLRQIIMKQNEKAPVEVIGLVKTDYGLRLKGYSQKTRLALGKMNGIKEISFNDMILQSDYPFEDKTYYKLYKKKKELYLKHSPRITDLPYDLNVKRFLDDFRLTNHETGEVLQFNSVQNNDLNQIFQRYYSILNWQMGGGKTAGSIAWAQYQFLTSNLRNVFVVSAAISIHQTWREVLPQYGVPFTLIDRIKDIKKIQPGHLVLITFEMLIKYQRQIKKFIRMNNEKVGVIVDESDELTSYSKRTKATQNCFRRVKRKLLATGTTTRNNINELYPQLELLYNNSILMLCECDTIYWMDKEDELQSGNNPHYMHPFPAYRGFSLFKECFNPFKVTVFGVRKHNQDVFNIDLLEDLIARTIVTRSFREIVGKDLYQYHQIQVEQNPQEEEIYRKIIEEFHQLMYYFRNTGNHRKESMLRIIRQIQLLIKSTSIPHMFLEYGDPLKLPGKALEITRMVGRFNEKVAIGTVFREAAMDYYQRLQEQYPERQVFLILGSIGFKARKKIIKNFEATRNGILVSTQQSLKCSVNIPTCNAVILESLQWNVPRLSQYAFRFVRFNSQELTNIYCVTYSHSIEQNILALLMAKERLNSFIKTLDYRERKELYSDFDIDLGILDQILEWEKDHDGKVHLAWGKQKIS